MRSIAANAAVLPTDAMKPLTGVGAPSYTSGVQKWNGTAATLKARPTSNIATPANASASWRGLAIRLLKLSTISDMLVLPATP